MFLTIIIYFFQISKYFDSSCELNEYRIFSWNFVSFDNATLNNNDNNNKYI